MLFKVELTSFSCLQQILPTSIAPHWLWDSWEEATACWLISMLKILFVQQSNTLINQWLNLNIVACVCLLLILRMLTMEANYTLMPWHCCLHSKGPIQPCRYCNMQGKFSIFAFNDCIWQTFQAYCDYIYIYIIYILHMIRLQKWMICM